MSKGSSFQEPGLADTKTLRGQHRAWSDGSVEWVNGSEMKLDTAAASQNASYWDGALYLWWF
jgi:hypothetical protein